MDHAFWMVEEAAGEVSWGLVLNAWMEEEEGEPTACQLAWIWLLQSQQLLAALWGQRQVGVGGRGRHCSDWRGSLEKAVEEEASLQAETATGSLGAAFLTLERAPTQLE